MGKNVLTTEQILKRMFVYALCIAPTIVITSVLLKNPFILLVGMAIACLGIYLLLRHWLKEDEIDINDYVKVQMDLKREYPNVYDEVKYLHNTRNNLTRLALIINGGELTPIDPIVFQHLDNPLKFVVKATPTSKEYYPFEFELQDSLVYKYY